MAATVPIPLPPMPFAPSHTVIAPDLLAAYAQTRYHVQAVPAFELRVGEIEPALMQWMQKNMCACAAFITACNPCSRVLSDAQNMRRQAQLADTLTRRGVRFVDALGCPKEGNWKPEPSFLVAGLPLEDAQQLGRQFGQNAVLWSGADARVQLVLLR